MAGMIAQDDGDETKTVVDHFAIVFQIVVLTCVDGVVVASLQQFGTHAHHGLSGRTMQIVVKMFDHILMNLWGQKYNDQADTTPKLVQRSVYDALADQFDANDVYVVCTKQGIKSPVRNICYNWKKLGYIEQTAKNMYKKIKK